MEAVRIDLGDNGGTVVLRSWDDARSFARAEVEAWKWLSNTAAFDPYGTEVEVQQRLRQLQTDIELNAQQSQPLTSAASIIASAFAVPGERLLHHTSDEAERLRAIAHLSNPGLAAFAYSMHRGRVNFRQGLSGEQFTALIQFAAPALIPPENLAARLRAERANTREHLRSEVAKLVEAERSRQVQWEELVAGTVTKGRTLTLKHLAKWKKREKLQRAVERQAIQDLSDVKATYTEHMKLKAPVEYWQDKSIRHAAAEEKSIERLKWYFPLAVIGFAAAFGATSLILLGNASVKVPTPVYFILSAGLGSLGALAFWIGRLLTRLYLSEHHLRKDAEERAVMTSTYLALTLEQAASDQERQIILSALFRSSADGIVKDDGPGDVNLAGLLARIGSPTR